MASTSSTSTVVATGKDGKPRPRVSTLQTPVSASYPSEIRSPLPGTPAWIKREENVRTPITPPHAYLDFLKTMSPALMSPAPTGTSSHFNFSGKVPERMSEEGEETTDMSHPRLSRTSSAESTATVETIDTEHSDTSDQSFDSTDGKIIKRERSEEPESRKMKKPVQALDLSKSRRPSSDMKTKPQSPRIIIPPSPFTKPASGRLTRRAQVPPSPLSPGNLRSPMSARSHHEPRSASCLSATPWSATYSPTEPESSKTSRVSVRQVVTRTVTYSATPLDPAPKGKRRKLEE